MLEAMRNLAARALLGSPVRLRCLARCRAHTLPGCDA